MLSLLHQLHLLVGALEGVVVASVVGQLEVLEEHHVRADLVQERSIVGHEEYCVLVGLQVALQPQHGFEVQVIRRLDTREKGAHVKESIRVKKK